MNDKIKELLGSNYKVTEDERVLKVFHIMENGMIEQEKYYKVNKYPNTYTLVEISRGNEFSIGEFNEIKVSCILYVLCMKNFENIKMNNHIIRALRKSNNTEEALRIIENPNEEISISFDEVIFDSICMKSNGELFNICYIDTKGGVTEIFNGISFNRAVVVLYNYGNLLKRFHKIFNNMVAIFPNIIDDFVELFEYYIGK